MTERPDAAPPKEVTKPGVSNVCVCGHGAGKHHERTPSCELCNCNDFRVAPPPSDAAPPCSECVAGFPAIDGDPDEFDKRRFVEQGGHLAGCSVEQADAPGGPYQAKNGYVIYKGLAAATLPIHSALLQPRFYGTVNECNAVRDALNSLEGDETC